MDSSTQTNPTKEISILIWPFSGDQAVLLFGSYQSESIPVLANNIKTIVHSCGISQYNTLWCTIEKRKYLTKLIIFREIYFEFYWHLIWLEFVWKSVPLQTNSKPNKTTPKFIIYLAGNIHTDLSVKRLHMRDDIRAGDLEWSEASIRQLRSDLQGSTPGPEHQDSTTRIWPPCGTPTEETESWTWESVLLLRLTKCFHTWFVVTSIENTCCVPSKQKTCKQCWFNVGLAS